MRSDTTATKGGPRIHSSVLEYEAACSAFADETDLATAAAPFPGTDPNYWLDTYPVLTEALANTEAEKAYGPEEAALDLAVIVSVRAEDDVHLNDSDALTIFLEGAIS